MDVSFGMDEFVNHHRNIKNQNQIKKLKKLVSKWKRLRNKAQIYRQTPQNCVISIRKFGSTQHLLAFQQAFQRRGKQEQHSQGKIGES